MLIQPLGKQSDLKQDSDCRALAGHYWISPQSSNLRSAGLSSFFLLNKGKQLCSYPTALLPGNGCKLESLRRTMQGTSVALALNYWGTRGKWGAGRKRLAQNGSSRNDTLLPRPSCPSLRVRHENCKCP